MLFSCNYESKESLSLQTSESASTPCSNGDIGFSGLNEGAFHNQLVGLIVENWSICSKEPSAISAEMKRILINKGRNVVEANNMNFEEFKSVLNTIDLTAVAVNSSLPLETYIEGLSVSRGLKSKIKDFVLFVEALDPAQSVSINQNLICNYYQQNSPELSADDLILYGAMVDVTSHSIECWVGTSTGGQNKYAEFQILLNNLCGNSFQRAWGWGKLFATDGIAMLAGAANSVIASGGTSAIPNPLFGGVPTAGVIGVVSGAAASATYAVLNGGD